MAIIQSTAKTVTLTLATEIVDSLCEEYGYQTIIPNPLYDAQNPTDQPETIANPQTKAQFSQAKLDNMIYTWIKNIVVNRRRRNITVDTTTTGL